MGIRQPVRHDDAVQPSCPDHGARPGLPAAGQPPHHQPALRDGAQSRRSKGVHRRAGRLLDRRAAQLRGAGAEIHGPPTLRGVLPRLHPQAVGAAADRDSGGSAQAAAPAVQLRGLLLQPSSPGDPAGRLHGHRRGDPGPPSGRAAAVDRLHRGGPRGVRPLDLDRTAGRVVRLPLRPARLSDAGLRGDSRHG